MDLLLGAEAHAAWRATWAWLPHLHFDPNCVDSVCQEFLVIF